jgi:hypothetical protein
VFSTTYRRRLVPDRRSIKIYSRAILPCEVCGAEWVLCVSYFDYNRPAQCDPATNRREPTDSIRCCKNCVVDATAILYRRNGFTKEVAPEKEQTVPTAE